MKTQKNTRQKHFNKYISFTVILILILIILGCTKEILLKKIYPIKYKEYAEKYAEEYGVDELLIYAIIKSESNFKENSTSSSGAVGLMQLMEETAKEAAQKIEDKYISKDELYNPELNIKLGTYYFSELLQKYDGNIELALIAYNAGTGNVANWIEKGIIKQDGSDIENVPYQETNMYVRKILRDYEIYNKLWG